jgi:hypothetical protein
MSDAIPDSEETIKARTGLAAAIWEYKHGTDGSAETIAESVDTLVENKINDFANALSERIEAKTGIRP